VEYTTLYDVINEPRTRHWIIPLLFFCGALFAWVLLRLFSRPNLSSIGYPVKSFVKFGRIFIPVFAILSLVGFVIIFFSESSNYSSTMAHYDAKKYITIEGEVTSFLKYQQSGTSYLELFTVDDIKFEFSSNDHSYYGYRPSENDSSSISEGQFVRISYLLNLRKRVILKLEEQADVSHHDLNLVTDIPESSN
jgi:hypothetical protein